MKLRRGEPVLITSAEEARPEEIRRREQRYILTMLVRIVCFVLAVVVFTGWLRLVAVGLAVILPWVAVVVANGGPARSDRRQAGFVARAPTGDEPRELTPGDHRVVDAEVVDAEVVDAGADRSDVVDAEVVDGEVVDSGADRSDVVDAELLDSGLLDSEVVETETGGSGGSRDR